MANQKSKARRRLDIAVLDGGLADSREIAKRLIMAGEILVDGERQTRPSVLIRPDARLTILNAPQYVSRGGDKLEHALSFFQIQPYGWVCADVGASTGGFTDCLLQHGAVRIYAIDVGYGQLAWKLRQDPRVLVLEKSNARYLDSLPEPVDLVTIDASFISLELLLPVSKKWLRQDGMVIALIKPQFEAGKHQVGKGGVVRDPAIHEEVIRKIVTFLTSTGFSTLGLTPSPLRGPSGNLEFLVWAVEGRQKSSLDIDLLVPTVVSSAHTIG